MKAREFLEAGIGHMIDRAATYDSPGGERSMEKTVEMFNSLLSDKLREPLSEEDGWNFMQILKLVRSKQGEFKADNYEDGAAYVGLAGEAAAKKVSLEEYHSFRDSITGAKKMFSYVNGITVAIKEKSNYSTVAGFVSNKAAAGYIEKHKESKSIVVWVDGVVAYDSFLSKDGELDKLLEHLKK